VRDHRCHRKIDFAHDRYMGRSRPVMNGAIGVDLSSMKKFRRAYLRYLEGEGPEPSVADLSYTDRIRAHRWALRTWRDYRVRDQDSEATRVAFEFVEQSLQTAERIGSSPIEVLDALADTMRRHAPDPNFGELVIDKAEHILRGETLLSDAYLKRKARRRWQTTDTEVEKDPESEHGPGGERCNER
jgi:hypothetical protein